MCLYLHSYTRCDNECGPGKKWRMQAPYTEGMDTLALYGIHPDSFEPHACVPDHHRRYKPCEGTLCDDTYKLSKFKKDNPGSTYTDYCKFIKDENACNDNYVKRKRICSDQCKTEWN